MTAKSKNILMWVFSGILAFAFLGSGITKLIGLEMQIKNFESWGFPLWMRFPVGLSEVVFAIGLLMPAYRKWIIYGIFPWGALAIYTHIQATPPQYEMIGAPLMFVILNIILLVISKVNPKTV